jgi:hypothetical protein
MSNKTYDTLKLIALILTPVLAFLASVANIWNIPYSEQIVATLTGIDTLVGAIVVALKTAYDKKGGDADVTED